MSEGFRRILAGGITAVLAAIIVVGIAVGDPTPADRAQELGARIKCPVCQGEAIVDSPSETAEAMMAVVIEQVELGQTNDEVLTYFKARYGDGILLDPPFWGRALALWLLPPVAILAGVVLILRRRQVPQETVSMPAGTGKNP